MNLQTRTSCSYIRHAFCQVLVFISHDLSMLLQYDSELATLDPRQATNQKAANRDLEVVAEPTF